MALRANERCKHTSKLLHFLPFSRRNGWKAQANLVTAEKLHEQYTIANVENRKQLVDFNMKSKLL